MKSETKEMATNTFSRVDTTELNELIRAKHTTIAPVTKAPVTTKPATTKATINKGKIAWENKSHKL